MAAPFTHPDLSTSPETALAVLRAADWSAFDPSRDLPPLRAALTALERAHGVTEAHKHATARIRERGAVLRHGHTHRTEITAVSLSPCGRWLATGSDCGHDYEDGGALQIWELATGRCVNAVDDLEGGVGWSGDRDTIQWSAAGDRIVFSYNTNHIDGLDPFAADWPSFILQNEHASSAPTFAYAPAGDRVFVVKWSGRDTTGVHGCVVPFDGDDDHRTWLTAPLTDAQQASVGGPDLFLRRVVWSPDGSRLHGHAVNSKTGYGREGVACAVDVASGKLAWMVDITIPVDLKVPAVWSPDGRLVAHLADGHPVIADAATGSPLTRLPAAWGTLAAHAAALHWGTRGTGFRLAVVAPRSGQVGVYDDDTGREHRLDVAVKRPDVVFLPDVGVWAWAPDGSRAACLTVADQVEIWSLGDTPQRTHVVDVPPDTAGVLWGAGDVLVAAGVGTLRFLRADTGEVLGDHAFLRKPPGPAPLDGDPLPSPTFALSGDTWAVAFDAGLVIAPADRLHDLDAALTWAVDRRYGWPVRWGDLTVVPDATTAAAVADRSHPGLSDLLAPFRR